MSVKILIPLGAVLVVALAGCAGPGPRSQAPPSRASTAAVAASPTPSTAAASPPAAADTQAGWPGAKCVSLGTPPKPSPTSASDLPGAPRTTVFIVGSVCSAATGQPIRGARVGTALLEQSCSEGHQPWRCAATAVTDSLGHYGIAVYDPGAYRLTVAGDGFEAGSGVVQAPQPGLVTADWALVPAG